MGIYDLELLRTNLFLGTSIFGCEAYKVYSDVTTWLSPGDVDTEMVTELPGPPLTSPRGNSMADGSTPTSSSPCGRRSRSRGCGRTRTGQSRSMPTPCSCPRGSVRSCRLRR